MANHKDAVKRNRQSLVARQRNRGNRSRLRTAMKNVRTAEAAPEAQTALDQVVSIIDRAARRGIIHPNAAARHKSRLTKHVRALSVA